MLSKIISLLLFVPFVYSCNYQPIISGDMSLKSDSNVSKDLEILNGLEKPFYSNERDWTKSVSRIIFNNAKTGFIIRGNVCLLNGEADRIEPISIEHPSSLEYQKGEYYDAITELNKENCKDTKYAWLEVDKSYSKHGLNINIQKLKINTPTKPTIPLFIQLEPYAFNLGINKGKYTEDHEPALKGLRLLAEHRIQPIKSWISDKAPVNNGDISFMSFVGQFKNGPTNLPDGPSANIYKNYSSSPWFYVVDEPNENDAESVQAKLDELKIRQPNIRRMVTTNINYPVKNIDIYCPVFQHIVDRDEYKGELWSYVSCMSHGCGENRSYSSDVKYPNYTDSHRSGEPDLTIDAKGEDILALFLIAKKLNISGLLYYDSITQWSLVAKGVDIFNDMYNFGGNGDGTLIYPDFKNKKPFSSLRLKLLREASYLADAVSLANFDLSDYIHSTIKWEIPKNLREQVYSALLRKTE